MEEILCSYCNKPAKLVTGKELFPRNQAIKDLYFWYCKPCSAWIGCFEKTDFFSQDGKTPMGTLAKSQLRSIRAELHKLFDCIWKEDHMRRGEAYIWLSRKMKLTLEDCHIAKFNYYQCCQAYVFVYKYLKARDYTKQVIKC
jgi:hypothetical protein